MKNEKARKIFFRAFSLVDLEPQISNFLEEDFKKIINF